MHRTPLTVSILFWIGAIGTLSLFACAESESCDHVEPCSSYNALGCNGTIRARTPDGELSPSSATFYALGESAPATDNAEAWTQCLGAEGCVFTTSCNQEAGTVHLWAEGYEVSSVPYTIVKDPDTTTGGCTVEGCLRVDDFESDVTLKPSSTALCTGDAPLQDDLFALELKLEVEDPAIVEVCAQTGNSGGTWPVWAKITGPDGNDVPPQDICAQFCGEEMPSCFMAGAAGDKFASMTESGSISLNWDNFLRVPVGEEGAQCYCREPAPAGTYGVEFCLWTQTEETDCDKVADDATRGSDTPGSNKVCVEAEFDYPGTGSFSYDWAL